ncbi:MAG TPA: hypothetical protein VEL82_07745 [Thermoplasmata archaeon]|nr:hypothetical protein [Thermoplasmata archaeon]
MVDVDSTLLSVQERDNWRRRMDVLERSLAEVREHRRRIEARLRRVRRDLVRLSEAVQATLPSVRANASLEMMSAASSYALRNR